MNTALFCDGTQELVIRHVNMNLLCLKSDTYYRAILNEGDDNNHDNNKDGDNDIPNNYDYNYLAMIQNSIFWDLNATFKRV